MSEPELVPVVLVVAGALLELKMSHAELGRLRAALEGGTGHEKFSVRYQGERYVLRLRLADISALLAPPPPAPGSVSTAPGQVATAPRPLS